MHEVDTVFTSFNTQQPEILFMKNIAKLVLFAFLATTFTSCGGVRFVPNGPQHHVVRGGRPVHRPVQVNPYIRPDGYNYNYGGAVQSTIDPGDPFRPGRNVMGWNEWSSGLRN